MTITNLSRLCSLLRAGFPEIDSGKDLSLLLEIGREQDSGVEPTQKQLCLCGIASAATIRRRLGRLLAKKLIRRKLNHHDGRSVTFSLSLTAARQLKLVCRAAKQMRW
jgi:DNA-binding MarR family transcriptional regulator